MYLPAQMSDAELRTLIGALIAQHGKDFRAVMPLAAKEAKGRADGKRVSELVREMTSWRTCLAPTLRLALQPAQAGFVAAGLRRDFSRRP